MKTNERFELGSDRKIKIAKFSIYWRPRFTAFFSARSYQLQKFITYREAAARTRVSRMVSGKIAAILRIVFIVVAGSS